MFLFRMIRFPLPTVSGLALAAAVLLLPAGPAAAQQPGGYPRLPPDAKGYEIVRLKQEYLQNRYRQRASATAQPGERPTSAVTTPRVVTYERPDGWARTHVLEGSGQTSQPIVRRAPAAKEPRVVAFQDPDGRTRTFVLEGSVQIGEPRQAIVRQMSK